MEQSPNSRFSVHRGAGTTIRVYGADAGDTIRIDLRTTSNYNAASGWNHFAFSWNVGTAQSHVYVNGISDKNEVVNTDGTIDYTGTDWHVGGDVAADTEMDLAEFYLAYEWLDLSVAANLAKLIDGNRPVYLGATGELVTGNQPIILLRVEDGGAASDFVTNVGSGGNFVDQAALALAPTSPSD